MPDHIFSCMESAGATSTAALPEAARDWALFLDIDGTLLDLAPTPDAVEVPSDLPRVIGEVATALDGALAIVSGRTVAWIDEAFAPLSLAAAGQHGAELRVAPRSPVVRPPQEGELAPIISRVAATAARWPGVVVEDKGISLAVHYRLAPERALQVRQLLESAAVAAGDRFHLLPGKMVIELKPVATSKGRVVSALMDMVPFAGRRPVFIGDDRTDEDGFREALARGGYAIQVGPGRSAIASHHIAGPAAVREWLAEMIATLRRGAA